MASQEKMRYYFSTEIGTQPGSEHKTSAEENQQDGPAKDDPVRTVFVNDGLAVAEFHRLTSYRRVYVEYGS